VSVAFTIPANIAMYWAALTILPGNFNGATSKIPAIHPIIETPCLTTRNHIFPEEHYNLAILSVQSLQDELIYPHDLEQCLVQAANHASDVAVLAISTALRVCN